LNKNCIFWINEPINIYFTICSNKVIRPPCRIYKPGPYRIRWSYRWRWGGGDWRGRRKKKLSCIRSTDFYIWVNPYFLHIYTHLQIHTRNSTGLVDLRHSSCTNMCCNLRCIIWLYIRYNRNTRIVANKIGNGSSTPRTIFFLTVNRIGYSIGILAGERHFYDFS